MSSQRNTLCNFCKNNKEPASIYTTHETKDKFGRVTCPQLFKYQCPICCATGESAHTRSYCPQKDQMLFKRPAEPSALRDPTWHGSFEARTLINPPDPQDAENQRAGQRKAVLSVASMNSRMFHNMSSVTNSEYNSAGKLRRAHCGPKRGAYRDTKFGHLGHH